MMDFLKEKFQDKRKLIPAGIIFLLIIVSAAAICLLPGRKEDAPADYNYNAAEQQIADSVKEYLSLFLELPEDTAAQIADEAVKSYNIILTAADADAVGSEHTEMIMQRIRTALHGLTGGEEDLTEEELDGLAAGITEIIWDAVLSRIKDAAAGHHEQDYTVLIESIQKQIDDLSEQKMRITVSAKITDPDTSLEDIDAESLLAAINTMTDEELQRLAAALGLSPEELQKLLNELLNANNMALDKELEEKLAGLKKELADELLSKYGNTGSAQNGSSGKNGTNGKNGKDGKDGENGKDGSDGKTTYIAYADDMGGAGFSLTPTETSKYVGTCITDADRQPADYSSYTNWQIYRTYIITTTTDEDGTTTVHIN